MSKLGKNKKSSFHQELVLNQWMMSFFSGGTLHALKERLSEDRHEGIDEDEVVIEFLKKTSLRKS